MRPMVCVVALSLSLALVGCDRGPRDGAAHFELGKPAPPLSVEKIVQPAEGTNATWRALRGKVVVLEFWATWCGPCVAAISHLNELADTFKDRPVQFIAVTDEPEALVRQFLTRKPMRAWVALDTDRSMFQAYGVEGIPRTIVVDGRGVVVADTHPTMLNAEALENVLAGRPAGLPVMTPTSKSFPATSSADDDSTPALVEVVIRKGTDAAGSVVGFNETGAEFRGCPLRWIIESAYDCKSHQIVLPDELRSARFDVKAKATGGFEAARPLLQSALTSALGLTLRRETRQLDGYRLLVPADGTHKLVPSAMDVGSHSGGGTDAAGMMNYTMANQTVGALCEMFGHRLGCPVRDETNLEGRFDVLLEWKQGDNADFIRAVREQLGLELQPAQQSVDMLIFESADVPPAAPAPATETAPDAPD